MFRSAITSVRLLELAALLVKSLFFCLRTRWFWDQKSSFLLMVDSPFHLNEDFFSSRPSVLPQYLTRKLLYIVWMLVLLGFTQKLHPLLQVLPLASLALARDTLPSAPPLPGGLDNSFPGSTPFNKRFLPFWSEPISLELFVPPELFSIRHLYFRFARLPPGPLVTFFWPGAQDSSDVNLGQMVLNANPWATHHLKSCCFCGPVRLRVHPDCGCGKPQTAVLIKIWL